MFTNTFPFGKNSEKSFLSNELPFLNNKFDSVTIIPIELNSLDNAAENIMTEMSLAIELKRTVRRRLVFLALTSFIFYNELLSKRIWFWNKFRLKRLIYLAGKTVVVKRWFLQHYFEYYSNDKPIILYTYWCSFVTAALCDLLTQKKNIKIVTRVHGYDLYEERYNGYIPFQKKIVKSTDKVFSVSSAGRIYLINKYPDFKHKVIVSYLGVRKAISLSKHSIDGILRIVSCSNLVKLKRVDLIIEGIKSYCIKYNQKAIWTHFGDGELSDEIQCLAKQSKSKLFNYSFKGFVSNDKLLKYYQDNPVDIFINTSETEGLPVSIQEAQSFAIPVIGTDVGGLSEIVNGKVGVLLSENPKPIEIADAINSIICQKEKFINMKQNSQLNWADKFDSTKNYNVFIKELESLIEKQCSH
ncbi:MAG: glycosyltransferase [Chloroflexia bacterium]|nr:glycosyltransferase [Chloroflexia bacterium]